MNTQRTSWLRFPTALRKMWSGGEVQAWLDEQAPACGLDDDSLAQLYRLANNEHIGKAQPLTTPRILNALRFALAPAEAAAAENARLLAERQDADTRNIAELAALRQIISDIVAALGTSAGCSPDASFEFLRGIPAEVAATVAALRQRIAELEAATHYYRAGLSRQRPEWVPARIRLDRDVFGDGPFRSKGVAAGEHDCQCNQWGAVTVVDRSGTLLGMRPGEFEVIAWKRADASSIQAGKEIQP